MISETPSYRLAGFFDNNWDAYVKSPKHYITPEQYKAVAAIRACRTEALGIDHYVCEQCGEISKVYHSCKNRFCPTCSWKDTMQWAEKMEEMMLDIPHRHVVFTLPHKLNNLIDDNKWKLLSATVMAIMSEIGIDGFKKFETAKQFCSWLQLAPNNKISGGRILSNKIPKGSNRLKIALRHAANAIGNLKDTHLSDFFRRIAFRKGRQSAVSTTARKLATIIWTMIVKKVPYNPPAQYLFLDQKRKMGMAKRIKKQMAKFDIKPEEIGFGNSLSPNYNF